MWPLYTFKGSLEPSETHFWFSAKLCFSEGSGGPSKTWGGHVQLPRAPECLHHNGSLFWSHPEVK